jgi:hypothetical protein
LRAEFGKTSLTFCRFLNLFSKLNNTHFFFQRLPFLFIRSLNLQIILRTEFGRASLTFCRSLSLFSKLNNIYFLSQRLFFLFIRYLDLQIILILRAGFGKASLTFCKSFSLLSRLNNARSLSQYLSSLYDQIRKLLLTIRFDSILIFIFDFEFFLFFEFFLIYLLIYFRNWIISIFLQSINEIGERELRNLNIDTRNITFRKKNSKKIRSIILISEFTQLPEPA